MTPRRQLPKEKIPKEKKARLSSARVEEARLRRDAAFADLETRSRNAWASEFQQKLALAKSHLPSDRPHSVEDRWAVRDLIWCLRKYLTGRLAGPRPPWDWDDEEPHPINVIAAARRAAAQLARERRNIVCNESGRKRMASCEFDSLVAESIKSIVSQWGIPKATASEISTAQVRRLANKK